MGTEADRREKAEHKQQFLDVIDSGKYPDWKVTVCFYKALHLVEMTFAKGGRHSTNHRERHDVRKREYQEVWVEYLPLYVQSRRARYKVRSISGQTVGYVQGRLAKMEELIKDLFTKKSK